MRFNSLRAVLVICLMTFGTGALNAQTSGDLPPAPGGAAIANYASLIQLIERTIDGDWAVNGGNSEMMEYRQGVRIDADGVIHRIEPMKPRSLAAKPLARDNKPILIPMSELGEWQNTSQLRWISLTELDRQLSQQKEQDVGLAQDLLGGLVRIDYVAFDSATKEWLLGGPAGGLSISSAGQVINQELALPPILLEDLLSVAPHVLNGNGELGCTIDPDPSRLKESHLFVSAPGAMKHLSRDPNVWVQKWRTTLGRQGARVIGLPQDSPTGCALLVADAHMKRLAFGMETKPLSLKSYWDETEFFGEHKGDMGLVRWWFTQTDHKIPMDTARHIYHFASSNVKIESQAQVLDGEGKQVPSSQRDLAAEAFAKNFSVQRQHLCFGRLRHIFDLAIAMEIIRLERSQGNSSEFTYLSKAAHQPHMGNPALSIDSIASTHKMPSGSIAAIVSGGASIELSCVKPRLVENRAKLNPIAFERSAGEETAGLDSHSKAKPFWR
jgi:hypothetical protein